MFLEILLYTALGFFYLFICCWRINRNQLYQENGHDFQKSLTFRTLFWLSPVLLISLWGILGSTGWVSSMWLPSPLKVAEALIHLLSSGKLVEATLLSLKRIAIGFTASAFFGTFLGLLAGTFLMARMLVIPSTSFLRYIPPTAFISLVVVYMGVDELYKYTVIFISTLFFNVSMVFDVVEDMDYRYVEMAKVAGFNKKNLFFRIILPYSAPRIVDVLRINLSAAWTFLVVAEIIGASGGLGHLIAISQRFSRIDELYAGIIAFGIIGLVTDASIERLSHVFFRWHTLSLKKG